MCTECGCHGHSHVNLDDLAHLKQHDPDGMLDLTIGLTEQIRKAVELARVVDLPASYGQVKNVIGTGMGGSGIGGAFCAQLFQDVLTVPMASNRDYTLPAYAGPDTLVIAGSYSGNTEETLTAAAEAQRRGCKVFCVTGGGELLAFAEKHGLPYAKVPTGLAPRAAAGYMFVPQVFALQKAGLIPDQTAAFEEAIALLGELLETWRPESKLDDNPTKQLAEELFGHIPLIYGEFGYLGVIAERWKDQINENSKVIAYNNVLPELNHNEVVGWELPEELAEVFSVVLLRDEDSNIRYQLRAEVTRQLVAMKGCGVAEVWTQGESRLAKLLTTMHFGDWVSIYLAAMYGVDPSSIDNIKLLKAKLAEAGPVKF